jgi:hypothetical protein
VTYAQRLQDLYSACLMLWMRTHTGPRFIVSSEGRQSHQPQVIRATHANSKILVPDGARSPNPTFCIGVDTLCRGTFSGQYFSLNSYWV